jgi:hypothetical protein
MAQASALLEDTAMKTSKAMARVAAILMTWLAACSGNKATTEKGTISLDMNPPAATMLQEKPLTVTLSLADTNLHVSVADGATPVMTDVWLYTIENGTPKPLTAFTESPANKRKVRRLMLPCKIGGMSSGLLPCDDGSQNGVMTDLVRDKLSNGMYTPAIKGVVDVALATAPSSPVLAVVAVEDERYAGAAAIDPSGQPVAVPAGLGMPEIHVARSYAKDVAPIINDLCLTCHSANGVAALYHLASYDDIVLRNYAYYEAKQACDALGDAGAQMACEQSITRVGYMVEPGAPANSNLARRSRPDELKSVSPVGALWYGNRNGDRFDAHGDRRMPSTNTSAVAPDMGQPAGAPTYFDNRPEEFQILFDWIAQGAPQ